jgi:hypothetical protein
MAARAKIARQTWQCKSNHDPAAWRLDVALVTLTALLTLTFMTSIPFDVLLEILTLVNFSDLPTLALTTRNVSASVLDQLYNHIQVRGKNMEAACQSIASNPELARRVHTLEVEREAHGAHLESILPALHAALRTTINLRFLVLDIDGRHSWVLKSAIGALKLRSFSCFTYTDQDLLDFLHDQTDLEEIVLGHSFIPYGRPISWRFPNLRKINATMSWVDNIVPGNPVSHVGISYIASNTPGALTSLGLTTTPIRHLEVPLHGVHPIPFQQLNALFPALEELTLSITVNWLWPIVSASKIR